MFLQFNLQGLCVFRTLDPNAGQAQMRLNYLLAFPRTSLLDVWIGQKTNIDFYQIKCICWNVKLQHSKLKLPALNLALSVIGCSYLVGQWIQAGSGIWSKSNSNAFSSLHFCSREEVKFQIGHMHFHLEPLNAFNLPEQLQFRFPDSPLGDF